MKMNLRFILTTLMVLLICGASLVASAQLFDGEREGLILGGGFGFAGVVSHTYSTYYDYADTSVGAGWVASGKIGYGLSDQLALFLSSPVRDFSPHFGFMYFTETGFYLQGLIGALSYENAHFASSDEYLEVYHFHESERPLFISGGVGYELRDQISLEFMLGYTRDDASNYYPSNIFMIAATFNVHFY